MSKNEIIKRLEQRIVAIQHQFVDAKAEGIRQLHDLKVDVSTNDSLRGLFQSLSKVDRNVTFGIQSSATGYVIPGSRTSGTVLTRKTEPI